MPHVVLRTSLELAAGFWFACGCLFVWGVLATRSSCLGCGPVLSVLLPCCCMRCVSSTVATKTGESGVDQLVEIIKVLGTPTKEEIHAMNPNYTEFKFPQIKAHPWTKVFSKRMPPDAIDLVSSAGVLPLLHAHDTVLG